MDTRLTWARLKVNTQNASLTNFNLMDFFTRQLPAHRRVQAFMMPLYVNKLTKFGYSKGDRKLLCTNYIGLATLLDDGHIACMLCDPWPKYCPYYDSARDKCECVEGTCDWKTPYIPKITHDDLASFVKHFNANHGNEPPRDQNCFSGSSSNAIW